ncbi:hypothetical protein [Lentibacillus juripiscarius]|uniref:Uncharacterized protein n=1 Tax=Lentibacillus juripiscarius TaxID=257446 RepID=A0ABW5V9L1_9BACI
MEQSELQQTLGALNDFSRTIREEMQAMEKRLNNEMQVMEKRMEKRMDERFDQVDGRFDKLEKKVDGLRVDLTETQETVDYLSSKNAQHERKLRSVLQS